jgi:hypothetical protein
VAAGEVADGEVRDKRKYLKKRIAICGTGVFYIQDGGKSEGPRDCGAFAEFLPVKFPDSGLRFFVFRLCQEKPIERFDARYVLHIEFRRLH